MDGKNKAIIILSMHRSGSSVLTGVLEKLGVYLGEILLPPAIDNQKGVWENVKAVRFNDDVLTHLNSSYHNLGALPQEWWKKADMEKFKSRLQRLIEDEFTDKNVWGVKDPRLCRLIPLWSSILAKLDIQPLYILNSRNPLEVAKSLKVRDGFPRNKSLLLWLYYMLEAERYTRYKKRVAVSYELLLNDWRKTIRIIEDGLEIKWPVSLEKCESEIESLIFSDLKHHSLTMADLTKTLLPESWIVTVVNALINMNESKGNDYSSLDLVASGLASAEQLFGSNVFIVEEENKGLKSDIHKQLGEIQRLKRKNAALINSTSWRLTAPLRQCVDKFKEVFKDAPKRVFEYYSLYGFKWTGKKFFEKVMLKTFWRKKVFHSPSFAASPNNYLEEALESYKKISANHRAIKFSPRPTITKNLFRKFRRIIFSGNAETEANNGRVLCQNSRKITPKFSRYPKLPTHKRKAIPPIFPKVKILDSASILMVYSDKRDMVPDFRLAVSNGAANVDFKIREKVIQNLHDILAYDWVILDGLSWNEVIRTVVQFSHLNYIPTIFHLDGDLSTKELEQSFRSTSYVLCTKNSIYHQYKNCRDGIYLLKPEEESHSLSRIFTQIMIDYKIRHLPKVSIVTVLYKKAKEIGPVLKSFTNQSYTGELEIIFVDDHSPDNTSEIVECFFSEIAKSHEYPNIPSFKIIKNEKNEGNCVSRNKGIENCSGEIVIIIDADCMINRDFIENHVAAHSFKDCDVAIGPLNIESHTMSPYEALDFYENQPLKVDDDCELQDKINPSSFLNCITRNFSIKRKHLTREFFDSHFSYSANPESGFGWEDIEMGYRLYKTGMRIKFISDAFSIHISHSSATPVKNKPLRSLKNFRRLFEKHPEFFLVSRRWTLETYEKICRWLDENGIPLNDDRRFLDKHFEKYLPARFFIQNRTRKVLRILSYPWHIPHQYELYKLPYQFTLVTDLGSHISRGWDLARRPLRENVNFKSIKNINISEFDLAILHFDENVLSPRNTNGVIGTDWGKSFKYFRENINLPKVAICHGTPQFYGQYDINYNKPNLMKVIEKERAKLVKFIGNILTVTNSHQAKHEWNFKNSKVIWHGFDPTEFSPTTYKRGILTSYCEALISRPYYRGYYGYCKVFDDFPKQFQPDTLDVKEPDILYQGNEYAAARFRNYVDEIRKYSIYFNSTNRSPMPRSRGEAMMCGLATVSLNNHDVDMFIKNGTNGFYSDDFQELKLYLLYLVRNPEKARKIGKEGRKTAMNIFNHDRYLACWEDTINQLL